MCVCLILCIYYFCAFKLCPGVKISPFYSKHARASVCSFFLKKCPGFLNPSFLSTVPFSVLENSFLPYFFWTHISGNLACPDKVLSHPHTWLIWFSGWGQKPGIDIISSQNIEKLCFRVSQPPGSRQRFSYQQQSVLNVPCIWELLTRPWKWGLFLSQGS